MSARSRRSTAGAAASRELRPAARPSNAVERTAGGREVLCHMVGVLDEAAATFRGTWSFRGDEDAWALEYAVKSDTRDGGTRTLALAGTFDNDPRGVEKHADAVTVTVCDGVVAGSGKSAFGPYDVEGVAGAVWHLRKLKVAQPPAPAPAPAPPKRRGARPTDGDALLVRYDGDDGGPQDGYYRVVLRDGQLYGRERGLWWNDPYAFDEGHDDWKWDVAAKKIKVEKAAPPADGPVKSRWAGGLCGNRELQRCLARHGEPLTTVAKEIVDRVIEVTSSDVIVAHACGLAPAEFNARWERCDMLVAPLRGINVQVPWSGLILDRAKTVEARAYDVGKYADEWLWLVETPGAEGRKRGEKHRITGIIRFSREATRYASLEEWRADEPRHRVAAGSPFDWKGPESGEMWGWTVEYAYPLDEPVEGPDIKGVISCRACPRLIRGVRDLFGGSAGIPVTDVAAAAPAPAEPAPAAAASAPEAQGTV